ncbi:uncharacterized protein LOC141592618 [Silene latifolia]|uniref:uncharacterized protein LOC141592618 n=1 Tax=Silene latifolia TaxID=37657 RepID=UPI003D78B1BA
MLQRTVQVSNLVPNITAEQLKRVFGVRATIVECTITDPEHVAYIEYSKPEQAAIAVLALNNLELGGRLLKVEMAKSLPPKPATSSNTHAALSIERGGELNAILTTMPGNATNVHCTRNATDNHKHNQPDSSVNMIGTRAHGQPDGLPRDPLE